MISGKFRKAKSIVAYLLIAFKVLASELSGRRGYLAPLARGAIPLLAEAISVPAVVLTLWFTANRARAASEKRVGCLTKGIRDRSQTRYTLSEQLL